MKLPFFSLIFPFALRDVSRSKIIFFLTTISLSIIFTAIFLVGGVLEGFGNSLSRAQTDSSGEMLVLPEGEDWGIENASMVQHRISSIDGIEAITPRYLSSNMLEYEEKKIGPQFAIGVDVEKEGKATLLKEKLIAGRFLQKGDSKKIVLGATVADALVGLEYDDNRIPIGEHLKLSSPSGNVWEYEVVGIVDAKSFYTDWTTFMTTEELSSFGGNDSVGQVIVRLEDSDRIDQVIADIKKMNLPVEVRTWKQHAGFVYDIILALGAITGGIMGILSAAVFMVTSVILYINFLQHRRQVGIIKSMGTSNGFIVAAYMTEAFIFSTLSFMIAFLIFYFMNMDSNRNPIPLVIGDFHTSLKTANIFWTFLLVVFSSVCGSVIPAVIAAKTNIVDVIRDA